MSKGGTQAYPGFDVDVHLSPKARSTLVGKSETVIVDAYFTAAAKAGTPQDLIADTGEGVTLGQVRAEVAPEKPARFEKVVLEKDALKWVDAEKVQVLVNVYSGRKTSRNNLLSCGTYEGSFLTIEDTKLPIDCKLIGE